MNLQFWKNASIQQKLISAHAVVIIIFGLAFGYYTLNSKQSNLGRALIEKGQALAATAAESSGIAVYDVDYFELNSIVESLIGNPNLDVETNVAFVTIADANGMVLGHSDKSKINKPLEDAGLFQKTLAAGRQAVEKGPAQYRFGRLIVAPTKLVGGAEVLMFRGKPDLDNQAAANEKTIGYIEIGLSTEGMHEKLKAQRNILLLFTTGMAFFGGAILYLFTAAALKPVKPLVSAIQKIASGDMSAAIEIGARDEIGQIGEAVNQMAVDLEAYVQKLNHANQAMARNEKMAAIGKLSAGVAHEINNPLSVISTYMQVIRRRGWFDERAASYLDSVDAQMVKISDKIKSLLNFAREGNMHFGPEKPDELLQKSIPLAFNEDLDQNVQVELSLNCPEMVIQLDKGKMDQVFLNIAMNARHAMPNGGKLRVASREMMRDELPESAWADGLTPAERYAEIVFEDEGEGIDPEIVGKIFDPFFTTKPPEQGTGLGLSICYGVVKEHGGAIYVESEPSQGSRFYVILPDVKRTESA